MTLGSFCLWACSGCRSSLEATNWLKSPLAKLPPCARSALREKLAPLNILNLTKTCSSLSLAVSLALLCSLHTTSSINRILLSVQPKID
ncbi:hypothetical protein L3X38_011490 [Prunus dulcis]|uniref:Uncharacterized protein n=1 Tax=Prunus dulcis TaxID=3755 RepID=A0AAD4ZF66_PRUDU|nr:hypothetical protein L3X38_011490 [Prunus dulcis]